MTLRHLRIFVTVCDCNSITAAAARLFLAQPSVSLAISELETYYGVKLFDRISKKLYITETGKRFLNYAAGIVSLFDDMEKNIKNWESAGTMRIGSSITIGTYLLPKWIKRFNEKFPQIKVQAAIFNSEEIEKRVMANMIDFALIEGIVHNDEIQYEKFMDDELALICGRNHPLLGAGEVNIGRLKDYDFILREKGSGSRELFDSTMLIHNIDIKPVWESISTHAIINAVSEGLGLSILPYMLVKEDIEAGNVFRVEMKDFPLTRRFFVIYHKNKHLTDPAKEFIRLCHGIES